MPARGKSRFSPKQKAKMIAGKLQGKTSVQVAAEIDAHPVSVRRFWGGHETLGLQLKRENAEQIRVVYKEGLDRTLQLIRQKKDPRLALAAIKVGLDYTNQGDPPLERIVTPPPPQAEGEVLHVTLEELLITYRKTSIDAIQPKPANQKTEVIKKPK